jgi:demethylmenaquinone methyltransferase/2-methoxy-6-polyprenyl-1,4-benzoquinol methylase
MPKLVERLRALQPMIDAARVQRRYRILAHFYDLVAGRPTARARRGAVALLALRPGDAALDLGCGTGLSIPLLVDAVGLDGRVVGAELSPEMRARARQKVESTGWQNVALVQANAEELDLGEQFDGILAFYTHDIMTSAVAIERAVAHLKPGGRFVAAGVKLATGWRSPLNAITTAYSGQPSPTGTQRWPAPWAHWNVLGRLQVKERLWRRPIGCGTKSGT